MGPTTIQNLDQEWPQQESSKTFKMRSMLSQLCAALAIFALNVTHSGFMSLEVIQRLEYFYIISWTGLLVGGLLAQIVGGRAIIILGGAALTSGWLICGWFSSITDTQWLVCIVLFLVDMAEAPSYVYLAEISQPKLRNMFLSTMYLSVIVGWYFRSYLEEGAVSKTIAPIMAVGPFFGLVLMFFLPDSPYRLANKGRYHRVESSLAWFRGWTTPANVKSEGTEVINNAQNNPTAWKLFSQMSLYLPFLIVCNVFLVQSFIIDFCWDYFDAESILEEIMDRKKYTASLILNIPQVLMQIAFPVYVTFIGKRNLILISLLGGGILLLVTSGFSYLHFDEIHNNVYACLYAICLAATNFFVVAITPIPMLLNGEVFPSRLRNLGVAFGLFFGRIFLHLALSKFWYFVSAWDVQYRFLLLACISLYGFVSSFLLFPRNENKSLVEIEQSSNSIYNLRRK